MTVWADTQMADTRTDPEPVQPAVRSVQRTFTEFTFDAAHNSAPHGSMHGHTFRVEVAMTGSPHPKYGWSHNLLEVHKITDELRSKLDHTLLNDIEGLPYASLENVAKWIWNYLKPRLDGLTEVTVRRGFTGQIEGCSYSEQA